MRRAAAVLTLAAVLAACGPDRPAYRPAPCGTPEACAAEDRAWADTVDAARRAGALRD